MIFKRGTLMVLLVSAFLLSLVTSFATANPPAVEGLTVAVVGDSTVCNYREDDPRRGWGSRIGQFFIDSVVIKNHARGGRSTKTFIKEGRWDKVLKLEPDVVLIQFGHNDSHAPGRPESTNAATDYQEYLHQYVADAKSAGIQLVLVTAMPRRYFKKGKVTTSLRKYARAMLKVAGETDTPCIDLYTAAESLLNDLGEEKSEPLFAKGDRTHFSEAGADVMAGLIAERISEQAINPLSAYLK